MDPSSRTFGSELIIRALSGAFVVLAILGGILLGGVYWSFIVTLIALISLWEFYNLLSVKVKVTRGIGFISALLLIAAATLNFSSAAILAITALIPFLVLCIEIVRRQMLQSSHAIFNMGGTLVGLIFIALPWTFLVLLRAEPWGTMLLITLFACTWSCDITAYLVGVRWGRTYLCENVSPKKTWEGFAAGVAGSLFCAGLLAFAWQFPPFPLLLLGLLCGLAGQIGDLGESLLKREAGVKDAGKLIPGHGGMLDRFDSILVNATLAFLIFEVIWH